MKALFAALLLAFVIGSANESEKVTAEEVSDGYQTIRDHAKKHSFVAIRRNEDGTFEGRKSTGQILPVNIQIEPRILAEMKIRDARIAEQLSSKSTEPRKQKSIEPEGCDNSVCSFEHDTCQTFPGCRTCWNNIPDTVGYCI